MEGILKALYALTEAEQERELTPKESEDYLYYVELLQENNIEIPFGVII